MPISGNRFLLTGFITGMMLLKIVLIIRNKALVELNPDEYVNYNIAKNFVNGLGFTHLNWQGTAIEPYAFHGSFPVFVFVVLFWLGIPLLYFIKATLLAMVLAYGASIYYFNKIVNLFTSRKWLRWLATICYAVYPPVVYYIGTLFWYENLVLPGLIYAVYVMLFSLQTGTIRTTSFILAPIIVTTSCLLRGQLILVYLLLFTCFLGACLVKRALPYKFLFRLTILTLTFMFLGHLPILIKNYRDFGAYILSTQPGYELWQGHNPVATGFWIEEWTQPTSHFYQVTVQQAPEVLRVTQYPESKIRTRLAWNWIKEHPREEVKLVGKKLKLFFWPNNFPGLAGYQTLNPVNATVHLLFLLTLAVCLCGSFRPRITTQELLLLAPIAGSLLLTLVFFMGHRWRYYAEPFLILFIVAVYQRIFPERRPAIPGSQRAGAI